MSDLTPASASFDLADMDRVDVRMEPCGHTMRMHRDLVGHDMPCPHCWLDDGSWGHRRVTPAGDMPAVDPAGPVRRRRLGFVSGDSYHWDVPPIPVERTGPTAVEEATAEAQRRVDEARARKHARSLEALAELMRARGHAVSQTSWNNTRPEGTLAARTLAAQEGIAWPALIRKLGFDPRYGVIQHRAATRNAEREKATPPPAPPRRKDVDREIEWMREHGPMARTAYDRARPAGYVSAKTILVRMDGGWEGFIRAAGFDAVPDGRRRRRPRYSDADYQAALDALAEIGEGRPVFIDVWEARRGKHPTGRALRNKYGSWPAVMVAAGLTPSKEQQVEDAVAWIRERVPADGWISRLAYDQQRPMELVNGRTLTRWVAGRDGNWSAVCARAGLTGGGAQ